MSKTTTLRFTPVDTWFFRESRPMEALGGSELASVFPPPPRTLLGAIRSAIGDASGVGWHEFKFNKHHSLRDEIGYGSNDLGPLSLAGPWLSLAGNRLYPAPGFLLSGADGFARLCIGKPEQTCLGRVRLPFAPGSRRYKPMEQTWCTRTGYEQILAGDIPEKRELYTSEDLFQQESRLGIARDNVRRITDDGLLYQTRHLRPRADLTIEAELTHREKTKMKAALARLGGEGRLAHIEVLNDLKDNTLATWINPPVPTANTHGLILILLTAARFPAASTTPHTVWLPPGFQADKQHGTDVWKGAIKGIPLTLHAAVLGKAQREGGWDMAERRPLDVCSLIPAGSAFYLTVDGDTDIQAAIDKLHGTQIGEDAKLGRGVLACGLWQATEFNTDTDKETT